MGLNLRRQYIISLTHDDGEPLDATTTRLALELMGVFEKRRILGENTYVTQQALGRMAIAMLENYRLQARTDAPDLPAVYSRDGIQEAIPL